MCSLVVVLNYKACHLARIKRVAIHARIPYVGTTRAQFSMAPYPHTLHTPLISCCQFELKFNKELNVW